ncbi:hypothetical protein EK904_009736 [Melospiza melodia maxima]|nr:hypothetical protein EK904_009736 [Melospiza melodia maxima]
MENLPDYFVSARANFANAVQCCNEEHLRNCRKELLEGALGMGCIFNVMMDKQNLKQQFLRQNISCEALKETVITSNLIQYLWDYLRWLKEIVFILEGQSCGKPESSPARCKIPAVLHDTITRINQKNAAGMCIQGSTAFKGKVDESSKEILLCKYKILDIESEDVRSGRRHLEEDLECFVSKGTKLEIKCKESNEQFTTDPACGKSKSKAADTNGRKFDGENPCKILQSVTLLMLDNSDRQGVYALYKDTCLSCFEIPNLSVLFVAVLGAPGWKFKRLYLANQQVCTLLHTAGIPSFIKSKQVFEILTAVL